MNALFFAQVPNGLEWLAPLGSAGVAGVMLAWFMRRDGRREEAQIKLNSATEARLVAIENASNRAARATLMLVLSLSRVSENDPPREAKAKEAMRSEVKSLHDEIEEAERMRAHERRE